MLPTYLALAIAITGWGPSGWGPSGCGPVGPMAAPALASSWEGWYRTEHGYAAAYLNGRQVGLYDPTTREYTPYDEARDTWGEPVVLGRDPRSLPTAEMGRLIQEAKKRAAPAKAGCPCGGACDGGGACDPCRCRQAAPVRPVDANYGVEMDKLARGQERYVLNGRLATSADAREALAGGSVPDDKGRLRLTVIGDPAARKRVVGDLATAPELAEFRERFVVQDYAPDHWAVSRTGFFAGGAPTVYVQGPDGRVLHRQDDYRGPADLAGALRRADPAYDRERDPDLRKLPRLLPVDLSRIPAAAWLLAAGALVLLLLRKGLP